MSEEIRRELQVKTDNFKNKRNKAEKERRIVFEEIDYDAEGIKQVKIEVSIVGTPNAFAALESKGLVSEMLDDSAPKLELVLRETSQTTLE